MPKKRRFYYHSFFIILVLLSFNAWSMSTSPSPSYSGSYTVYWSNPTTSYSSPGADTGSTYLSEKVGSGSWTSVSLPDGVTQHTFSGKSIGSYSYKISYYYCVYSGYLFNCYTNDIEGPITVQVKIPATPSTLTSPSTDNNGAYYVSWSSVTGATSYQLQENLNGGAWSTIDNGSGTTRSRSGLANGTWNYRVRACSGTGCSAWSSTSSTIVANTPAVPAALTTPSTDNNGAYYVSWNSETGATSYQLQENLNGGTWSTIDNGSGTTRSRSGLANGTWYYRLRACATVSTYTTCSGWSSNSSTIVANTPAAPSTPTAPATDDDGAYTVSWSSITGATSYQLQENQDGGTWATIYNNVGTSTTRSRLSNGTWNYRVAACDTVSTYTTCSSWSGNSSTVVQHTKPFINSSPVTVSAVTSPYSYYATASTPAGSTLTYSLTTAPSGMIINANTGVINWDKPVQGQYSVTVHVQDDWGDSDDQTYALTVSMIAGGDVTGLFSLDNSSTTIAGKVNGSFDVDKTGASNYTIPIIVPPGTSGMQPSLALSYNSRSDNSLLGIGWFLSGLSAITRCPATEAQDSMIDPVNFDNSDRFCLDGKRLIAINGTYGSDGTEYRTEVDSFSKIISYGSAGNGPAWFKVWTKSGHILEYGNTDDSRIEAQGKNSVRVWAENKVSDSVGNYLTISYIENNTNGEFRPDRIDYTGNDNASLLPYDSVQFIYASRSGSDIPITYLAGSIIKTTERLKNVKTYSGSTLVKDYQLIYDNNGVNNASRITQVKECDGSGECLAPTIFNWQGNGANPTFANTQDVQTWSDYKFITGDWNGDGKTDLLLQYIGDGTSKLYTANNNGVMQLQASYSGWGTGIFGQSTTTHSIKTGDWNGDGRMDIAVLTVTKTSCSSSGPWTPVICSYDRTLTFYTSTGTGMTATGQSLDLGTTAGLNSVPFAGVNAIKADWNADGRTDLLINNMNYSSSSNTYNMYLGSSNGQMINTGYSLSGGQIIAFGDWNGDGRTDIILNNSGTGDIYFSDGSSFQLKSTDSSIDWNQYKVIPADYNGDGYTDLFLVNTSQDSVKLYLAKGDGTFLDSGYSSTGWLNTSITVGDWNGDGKADLVRKQHSGSTTNFFYSTGSGMVSAGYNPSWDDTKLIIAGDWNGDGLTDIWLSDTDPSVNTTQYKTEHSGFDLINTITDGMGENIQISYKPLTDSSVYTRSGLGTYPNLIVQNPTRVVDMTTRDNGIGGTRSQTYSYTNAILNTQGRGYLGFATMADVDSGAGIKTICTFRQDFPYIGMVSQVEQQKSDNTTIGKATTTYSSISTHTGTKYPYASHVVKENREIDGSLVSTTTTDITSDNYGNMTSSKVTIQDAGDSTQTFVTYMNNTFSNDTSAWHLGLPTRVKTTRYLPGNTDTKDGTCTDKSTCATRVSSFSYDANGLINQGIVEPDNPAFSIQTDYTYDSFGNKTDATVSGADIATRTTSTSYDANGQFAVSVTNGLNQTETHTWDDRFGEMVSSTNPNNLTTSWSYDGFGRMTQETRPDGTVTQIYHSWCTSLICPTTGVLKTVKVASGKQPVSTMFDKLGRVIKIVTQGFDGSAIEVDTVYDALGRVRQKSRPYFDGNIVKWNSVSYDILGRPLTKMAPNNSVTSISYNGLSTSITNDKGQTTTRIMSARGDLSEVIDANNNITNYHYNPFGKLIEVDDPDGNTTTNTYDMLGHKTNMNDPDMGQWSYVYDVLGELVSQTDAKNQVITMAYDKLGRIISRDEPEGTTTWTYDTANHGIGEIASVTGDEGETKTYLYDTYSRPSDVTTTIDGNPYTVSFIYDATGRVDNLIYPLSYHYSQTGLTVGYRYNPYGYLEKVCESGTACIAGDGLYWKADSRNASAQLTQATYGNGVVNQRTYDPDTGFINSIQTNTPAAGTGVYDVQDLTYNFDTLGNLVERKDLSQNNTEDYTYDALNRLLQTDFNDGSQTTIKQFTYDALGNLISKAGIGNYTYGGSAGPHAVTAAGGHTFSYDANGNRVAGWDFTTGQSRSMTWSSYNKPQTIALGSTTLTFHYGANRTRFKQENNNGLTTIYIGKLFEKRTQGSVTTYVHYIMAGGAAVAMYKSSTDNSEETRYLHRDNFGSITTVTDESAAIVERLSYDAWGKRRNPDWTDSQNVQLYGFETPRGYTGHEMLDDVGLIHMNGRIYDPDIGRMTSSDPYVQSPADSQSYNRYSYVMNNPLSYTDPSGYSRLPDDSGIVVIGHQFSFGPTIYIGAGGIGNISVSGGGYEGGVSGYGSSFSNSNTNSASKSQQDKPIKEVVVSAKQPQLPKVSKSCGMSSCFTIYAPGWGFVGNTSYNLNYLPSMAQYGFDYATMLVRLSGLHGLVANRAASFLSADITFGISNMFPSGGGWSYSGYQGIGSSYQSGFARNGNQSSGNSVDLGAEYARLLSDRPSLGFWKGNVLADSFATHADTAMSYVGAATIGVSSLGMGELVGGTMIQGATFGISKDIAIKDFNNEPITMPGIVYSGATGALTASGGAALISASGDSMAAEIVWQVNEQSADAGLYFIGKGLGF